jgi:hypothetical protein
MKRDISNEFNAVIPGTTSIDTKRNMEFSITTNGALDESRRECRNYGGLTTGVKVFLRAFTLIELPAVE